RVRDRCMARGAVPQALPLTHRLKARMTGAPQIAAFSPFSLHGHSSWGLFLKARCAAHLLKGQYPRTTRHRVNMNRAEFNRRLDAFFSNLLDHARKLTGNEPDAWDLVQDSVVRALEKLDQVETSFGGWLIKVQTHLFYQRYRRRDFTLPLPL